MKRENIKIVFMGTPEFAKCSLECLVSSGYNVVGVFTNPDTLSGRGMKLTMSPVKTYAMDKNILVFQPERLKYKKDGKFFVSSKILKILNELKPDVICVTAYGKILPKEVIEFPKYGCINVHGSLLPKYRGAAPIHHAIMNGEKETGITTMFMDTGMDTGDMLLKKIVKIEEKDNLQKVHDKLMIVGGELLVETIDKVVKNDIVRIKQGEEFTVAPMIDKSFTKIVFNKTSKEIFNFVRGLSPFPSAYIVHEDNRIFKVLEVKISENREGKIGEVVNLSKDILSIKCSDGCIDILKIKPENSKVMDITSFLNGNKIKIGDMFV